MCSKEIEGGQDPAIWSQTIGFHDVLVVDLQCKHASLLWRIPGYGIFFETAMFCTQLNWSKASCVVLMTSRWSAPTSYCCKSLHAQVAHRISDINIGFIRNIQDCRVQVENVCRISNLVRISIHALQQSCLARASHPCAVHHPLCPFSMQGRLRLRCRRSCVSC